MLHATVELDQCTVEVRNSDQAIVFSGKDGQEILCLSFADFDEILEAVAKTERFDPSNDS